MTHDEAVRGIYVDFECLQTEPHPTPKLLGVLVEDEFEQLILDPLLAPARVANQRCRVEGMRTAIVALVERAEREQRALIGWSLFDRDVAKRAAPEAAGRLDALYRNALPVARRWRQLIHPSVQMVAEDPYAPKHTLDKYARLTRYPHQDVFKDAKPAQWIRHTLEQLNAHGGRYRATTSQTKRDWHKLLEYNKHDCRALDHIAKKTTRETEAWRAYRRTRYCVDQGGRRVGFMVGGKGRGLQALLERHKAKRFAFITAWNPGSEVKSHAENERQQARLRAELVKYTTLPGEGVGEDARWEPEESLMVFGISRGKAVALGHKYGQLAIVFGKRDSPAELVSCADFRLKPEATTSSDIRRDPPSARA